MTNMLMLLVSRFSHVRLCATPQMAAHQAPLSMGFSRQAYWSGCHFLLHCLKVKEEGEKVGLNLNIQKMKIMACDPITSWEIDGETVETVSDFILGAPKLLQMVTAAMKLKDAYSLEGKL